MEKISLSGKHVLVVGAGLSGVSAAKFLCSQDAAVSLYDDKSAECLSDSAKALLEQGVTFLTGAGADGGGVDLTSFSLVVASPGVSLKTPLLQKADSLGLPIIGELELAYLFSKGKFIAITGTNGKTTTTSLTAEIFRAAGTKMLLGGNIGLPLAEQIALADEDTVIVAEVSSFQLETAQAFHPVAAAVLNITPDHLDRHGDMAGYTAAKSNVFAQQGKEDFTVLNYDDENTRALGAKTNGQVVFFSRKEILPQGVYVEKGEIVIAWQGKKISILPCSEIYIKGNHNLENALAAVALSWFQGVGAEVIADTLRSFRGVAHRLEFVAEVNGVQYINDSKGTNVDSTIKALETYPDHIIWIAGGRNKGASFDPLIPLVRERVTAVVVLGESAELIREVGVKAGIPSEKIYMAKDLPDVVAHCHSIALPGDVVLLSPACASWDMFRSYEERGDIFKDLVHTLE